MILHPSLNYHHISAERFEVMTFEKALQLCVLKISPGMIVSGGVHIIIGKTQHRGYLGQHMAFVHRYGRRDPS